MLPLFDKTKPPINVGPGIIPKSPAQQNRESAHQQISTSAHQHHRPSTPRVSGRQAIATPSISGALKEPSAVHEKEPSSIIGSISGPARRTQPFSQEDLLKVWKEFTGKIDSPQLKSALSTREPVIKEQWQVSYELDNEMQQQRLTQDLKPKLLNYLRRHLNNDTIDLSFSVLPHHNPDTSVPYTDSEKWQVLVKKYPALEYLKSKFGLDFE